MTTQSNERERQAAKKIVAPYMSIGVNTMGAKFAEHIAEALADVREQCAEIAEGVKARATKRYNDDSDQWQH